MTELAFAGCPWPIDDTCLDILEWEAYPEAIRDVAVALASNTLHMLSAKRVGGCPITVRPAPQGNACLPSYESRWMTPGINASGYWVNNVCGSNPSCVIDLPPPVGRLLSVKVDGDTLDLTQFRVDDGSRLVYQGPAPCPLPVTQDLRLADTEPGTFSVTYLNAYPVDRAASIAMTYLAVEYAIACTEGADSRRCRLPASVSTIVRMGVTMELANGVFPDGFTGISETDAWLSLVNPKGRRQGARIWSPDAGEPVIQGRTGSMVASGGGSSTPILDGGTF